MKLKFTFATSKVLDQIVAVPISDNSADNNFVFSLNETAEDILLRLQDGKSREAVVEELLTVYDATRAQLEEEVDRVIAALEERNLIIEY